MPSLREAVLRGVRIGAPSSHGPITIIPLLQSGAARRDLCLMLDEALDRVLVVMEEVGGDRGVVAELRVENRAEVPLLLVEGDELEGGKQNRVLNTTLLVAARSSLVVPVSCVEQGRWSDRTSQFRTGHRTPHRLRMTLRGSVSVNLERTGRYTSDQGAVWGDVSDTLTMTGGVSATSNLSDSFAGLSHQLRDYVDALPAQHDQVGVVVFFEGRALALELYPDTRCYARAHARIVESYALSAAVAPGSSGVESGSLETFLDALDIADASVSRSPSIGLGRDVRAQTGSISIAGLELEEELVYLSALSCEVG